MALEAVIFSQDPLTSYNVPSTSNNFGMNYEFDNYSPFGNFNIDNFDLSNSDTTNNNPVIFVDNNVDQWDQHYNNNNNNNQPQEEHLADEPSGPPVMGPGPRRKIRRRSNKNKEEVEQQRMTHIAVERNRRKQMNEYLAVIRSLMPPSYVQRGDQASIVGGAINYVKELEQMLQSMEARKHEKMQQHDHVHHEEHKPEKSQPKGGGDIEDNNNNNNAAPEVIFADFFSYPQYSTRTNKSEGSNSAVNGELVKGEIEVTMVDSHANVKILTKKQPKQLVKLIANFQGLRLNVLHLNVTTLDSFVLYSLNLKVEEGCQLKSVDDIAAASNHILGQIQEEAAILL